MWRYECFRDRCKGSLYDFHNSFRPYHLVSCCGWGPGINNSKMWDKHVKQEIYFGTRADEFSSFNRNKNKRWMGGQASLLAVGEVDLAQRGY